MRGKIDLGAHKLANVYRAPARSSRRTRAEKATDEIYRQLWRLVDGGVRDALNNHPEYLTEQGKRSAANSIVKRVAGTLHGYAAQVAQGRSRKMSALTSGTAAERTGASVTGHSPATWFARAVSWVRFVFGAPEAGRSNPARNSSGDRNG